MSSSTTKPTPVLLSSRDSSPSPRESRNDGSILTLWLAVVGIISMAMARSPPHCFFGVKLLKSGRHHSKDNPTLQCNEHEITLSAWDVAVLFSIEALYWIQLLDRRQSFVRDGTLSRVLFYSTLGMICVMLRGEDATIVFLIGLPWLVTTALTVITGWRLVRSWTRL
ncbi:hypothetical protein LIA77_02219 [Sarocladium implicatum]|nr:hypothetical protein LIA77_02219 [Sarocladium implicatum]